MVCSYTRFVSLLSAKGNCHCHRVVYQTMETFVLLSSYTTVSACIHAVGTYAPTAYSGVAANATTVPCTIGHHAHSSCPSWLSFISVIFQAQLGANCLAGCLRNQGSKCQVTAHRLWYVATQGLSVYCLQKGTENSFVIE